MVVDALLRHWVTVVESTGGAVDPGADGMEGFGQDVQRLAEYFYVDDGILVLTWTTRLQREFETLTEFFERVGL